jgi:hypothetical protein
MYKMEHEADSESHSVPSVKVTVGKVEAHVSNIFLLQCNCVPRWLIALSRVFLQKMIHFRIWGFEVVVIKSSVVWDIMLCSLMNSYTVIPSWSIFRWSMIQSINTPTICPNTQMIFIPWLVGDCQCVHALVMLTSWVTLATHSGSVVAQSLSVFAVLSSHFATFQIKLVNLWAVRWKVK